MLHCISWMSNTPRCKNPLHDTKLLFHRGGVAKSVTVLSLAFLYYACTIFPSLLPSPFLDHAN